MIKGYNPDAGQASITVLVCSAQKLFSQSLAAALRTRHRFEVITVHPASGQYAVAAAGEYLPGVVVADAWMADMAGPEMVSAILKAAPATKVILISGRHSAEQVNQALAAGAAGFLPSSIRVAIVADGIKRAHDGESPIFAKELKQMLHAMQWRLTQSQQALKRLEGLTPRERTIMEWMATGASVDAIAERLFITVKTVKNHVQNILAKTGAGSQQEALLLGRSSGMIPPAPTTQDPPAEFLS